MEFLIVLLVFIAMEGATWLIHKYVMHGFLWMLHKDHHDHSNAGSLEKNDYFFHIRSAHYCINVLRFIKRFQLFVLYRFGHHALWACLFFCTRHFYSSAYEIHDAHQESLFLSFTQGSQTASQTCEKRKRRMLWIFIRTDEIF